MTQYQNIPIVRRFLPHTDRLDGDDTGFRGIPVCPLDKVNPDPLVLLNLRVKCYPTGGRDIKNDFEPQLSVGISPEDRILLREPAAKAIEEANERLRIYNRELVVTDGFRHVKRQSQSFGRVFRRFLGENIYDYLSAEEQIRLGRKTNGAILYVAILKDAAYEEAKAEFISSPRWEEVIAAATELDESPQMLLDELLAYEANLGLKPLLLDTISNTAHGTGGSIDVRVIDTATGRFVNRGIPSSYNNTSAVMDYFEWATPELYQEEIDKNPPLKDYLKGHGIEGATNEVIESIRNERRILFHAMMDVGASYFSLGKTEGECWHFNFGNERGGNQFSQLSYAGNPSHSLLKNVRDKETGKVTAVWGNETAHKLAEPFIL